MEKEIVIITGSAGRIGANIAKRLGEEFRVVGFELLKAIYASSNEELVPVDLTSDESVHQAFAHIRYFYGNRIAAVVHLAAFYSFSEKESPLYEKVTVQGTERLLKALQGFEVDQFIFSSTMLVHAPCKVGQTINEESPLEGKWGYPKSKIRTEQIIKEFRGKIPTVILRIAGVYDDQCHSIPISQQIQRIYENTLESHLFSGNLSHGASFLHMDDLVDAIQKVVQMRKQLPPELILLLGEPKTLSYDDLQRQISKSLHGKEITTYSIPKCLAKIGAWIENHLPLFSESFIKPWMIEIADNHYALDISKAKKTLQWEPKHSVDVTLKIMLDHLKEDPVKWYKENNLDKK